MSDPLTLAVITTAVIAGLGLILNIFQYIKLKQFSMSCSDCCSVDIDPCPETELK